MIRQQSALLVQAVNRIVDAVFISDIFLQFFVAYPDERAGGTLARIPRSNSKKPSAQQSG